MTCPIRKVSFFVFGTGKFTLRTGGGGGAGGCAVRGAQWGPVDSPPALQREVRSGFFSLCLSATSDSGLSVRHSGMSDVSRSYMKKLTDCLVDDISN